MPNTKMSTWRYNPNKQAEEVSAEVVAAAKELFPHLLPTLALILVEQSPIQALASAMSAALHFARYNMTASGLVVAQGDAATKLARDARA